MIKESVGVGNTIGCKYYFNYIPLQELGLPVPDQISNTINLHDVE